MNLKDMPLVIVEQCIRFKEAALLEIGYLQAQIDRLMLEYCPDEMTKKQLDEWGKNQKLSKLKLSKE